MGADWLMGAILSRGLKFTSASRVYVSNNRHESSKLAFRLRTRYDPPKNVIETVCTAVCVAMSFTNGHDFTWVCPPGLVFVGVLCCRPLMEEPAPSQHRDYSPAPNKVLSRSVRAGSSMGGSRGGERRPQNASRERQDWRCC